MNEFHSEKFTNSYHIETWLNGLREKGKYGVKVESMVALQQDKVLVIAVRWLRNPVDKVMGAFYKEGDVAQPEAWTEPTIEADE